MTVNVTGAVTGAVVNGFTAPTYTLSADSAPTSFGKQGAVTALGGTQTGVLAHSVDIPFTFTTTRPAVLKRLEDSQLIGTTGRYARVPNNTYSSLIRKGLYVAPGQMSVGRIRIIEDIPAGAVNQDLANVAAMYSLAAGVLWAQAQGILDRAKTGIN